MPSACVQNQTSHLHHHFGAPMRNFGVTTPAWDRIWGTYDDPGIVAVPRRMAPAWLLDTTGEVKAEFAHEYVAKGTSRSNPGHVERERADAFTNVAPGTD